MDTMLLPINPYSRAGVKRHATKAIVVHWVANPMTSAKANANYFASLANQKVKFPIYGSAHYIIGLKGEGIQVIPEEEIAYHCGSTRLDPASGMVYTNIARAKFGTKYCVRLSPNFVTIGIELCHTDWLGTFTPETYSAAVALCAELLKKYNLTTDDLLRHYDIVGWKDCPKWFVNKPDEWAVFKRKVEIRKEELS